MRTRAPRTAGALLLICALLMAAAPSAAAPARPATKGPSLLQTVQGWLALWLADSAPFGPAPEVRPRAAVPDSEPDSAVTSAEDDPVAQPQVGPEADPSG